MTAEPTTKILKQNLMVLADCDSISVLIASKIVNGISHVHSHETELDRHCSDPGRHSQYAFVDSGRWRRFSHRQPAPGSSFEQPLAGCGSRSCDRFGAG